MESRRGTNSESHLTLRSCYVPSVFDTFPSPPYPPLCIATALHASYTLLLSLYTVLKLCYSSYRDPSSAFKYQSHDLGRTLASTVAPRSDFTDDGRLGAIRRSSRHRRLQDCNHICRHDSIPLPRNLHATRMTQLYMCPSVNERPFAIPILDPVGATAPTLKVDFITSMDTPPRSSTFIPAPDESGGSSATAYGPYAILTTRITLAATFVGRHSRYNQGKD
jgi:hypothetical protein